MKPSKGWAIVNKKSGEISMDSLMGSLHIFRIKKDAKWLLREHDGLNPKDYTIIQIAIIPVNGGK